MFNDDWEKIIEEILKEYEGYNKRRNDSNENLNSIIKQDKNKKAHVENFEKNINMNMNMNMNTDWKKTNNVYVVHCTAYGIEPKDITIINEKNQKLRISGNTKVDGMSYMISKEINLPCVKNEEIKDIGYFIKNGIIKIFVTVKNKSEDVVVPHLCSEDSVSAQINKTSRK